MPCECCKKPDNIESNGKKNGENLIEDNEEIKTSCFSCCKKSKPKEETSKSNKNHNDLKDGRGKDTKEQNIDGEKSGCFGCWKKKNKETFEPKPRTGCFGCCSRKKAGSHERIIVNIEDVEEEKKSCWDKMKCCRTNKVSDKGGWFNKKKNEQSWAERRDSILSEPKPLVLLYSFFISIIIFVLY